MLDEYYLEVEPNLSELQRKNFLAFAQHHGMPTNLLDFSFSPLVSLYFCTDKCKSKGYVYFISKHKLVQINKVLTEKPVCWGLLDELMSYNPQLIKSLLPGMVDSFYSDRLYFIDYFEKHTEKLVKTLKNIKYIGPEGERNRAELLELALDGYKKDKITWDEQYPDEPHTLQIFSSVPNFLKGFSNIYKDELIWPNTFYQNFQDVIHEPLGAINPGMMIMLLKHEAIQYIWEDPDFNKQEYEMEFPYYFTYHPPVIDDRVRNQQSVFIFQPYAIKKHMKGDKDVYIWQEIKPDFIIEINNPDSIRKELDAIGINLKTIYCDFDSIAKYIKNSV